MAYNNHGFLKMAQLIQLIIDLIFHSFSLPELIFFLKIKLANDFDINYTFYYDDDVYRNTNHFIIHNVL